MDKAKILEKIKKCLALGKSSNANEAATALRQAQALMRKHGISEADIEALGYGSETVDIPVQKNKKTPVYLTYFVALMRRAFAVRPVFGSNRRISDISYTVEYFGQTSRVMTAAYAHTVCWRAMNKAWAEHLKQHPYLRGQQGARSGFFVGWLDEVWDKVVEIGFTEEEEAKTAVAIQQRGLKLVENQFNDMKIHVATQAAGKRAAADFEIHRPVGMEKLRLR